MCILFLVIFFGFILFLIYLYFENNSLQISYYDVFLDESNASLNGFKIVHISDYHNLKSKKLIKSLVNSIIEINPDIIVVTGDLIDAYKTNIDASIDFIKKISFYPIYYVNGNHEAKLSNYGYLVNKLLDNNVIVLDNNSAVVKYNNSYINILGISDPLFKCKVKYEAKNVVSQEISALSYNKSNFSILLSHKPEFFDIYALSNINLVLSGHVHGGQIRLPFFGGLYNSTQVFFPIYTKGVYNHGNVNMVVSRGISGTLPIRVNNKPELVVVTLKNS